MPVIREYVSRGTPQAQLAGANLSGAQIEPAGAMVELGRTLSSVVSHYEEVRRDTVSAKAAATATRDLRQFVFEMQNGSQAEDGTFTPPPDPVEHPARFQEKVKQINETYAQELGDEDMVAKFQSKFAPQVTASLLDVQKVSLDQQRAQVEADIAETEDALAKSVVQAGTSSARAAAEAQLEALYARAVESRVWEPKTAVLHKQAFSHQVAKGLAVQSVLAAPEMAKKQLMEGQWDAHLEQGEIATLIGHADTAIRAKAIEEERLRIQQERQEKAAREETMDVFVADWASGRLSTDTVLGSNLLAHEKEHFLALINKANGGGDGLKDDPGTFFSLFQRIHLPSDDPRAIRNETQLYPYVGNGLGVTGLNHLRTELKDLRNPDNASLLETRKRFFEGTKSSITKSSPFIADPEGDAQAYQFWQYAMAREAELRDRGEDVFQLYNPQNPKMFLGAPEVLRMFQRTPTEIMDRKADRLRNPSPGGIQWPQRKSNAPPRQEGETAQQYLDRIGEP